MKVQPEKLYHVYSQGNNKELIFGDRADYLLFLEKIKLFLAPESTILAYCLMPNHFHFLLEATKRSCEEIKVGSLFLNLSFLKHIGLCCVFKFYFFWRRIRVIEVINGRLHIQEKLIFPKFLNKVTAIKVVTNWADDT